MTSSLKRQAAKGVGWSLIDRTLTKTLGFGVFLIMTSLLPPRAFGLVAMAMVVLAFVWPFITQGTGPAIIQRSALQPEHSDTAFWISLAAGLIATVLVGTLAKPIAATLGEPALGPILTVLSLRLVIESLATTHAALLRRSLSFRALAVRSLVAEISGGVVGLAMLFGGFGVWSLVGQTLARQAASTISLWVLARWRPAFRFSVRDAQEMLRYGYSVIGPNLIAAVRGRIDQLLIGALLGTSALGFYVVALRFVDELGNLIVGSIGVVAFPTFSRLQAERQKLVQAFLKATEYSAFLAFPAFVGLGVIAGEFVPVVLGPQWAPSVPIIRALVPMGMVVGMSVFNRSMIAAKGKPSLNVALGLLDLCVGMIAILTTVPLGLVAMSLAYSLSTLAGYSAGLWVVRRMLRFGIRDYVKSIGLALLAASAMGVLVAVLGGILRTAGPDALRLVLLISAGGAFYVGLVRILRGQLLRELIDLSTVLLPVQDNQDVGSNRQ